MKIRTVSEVHTLKSNGLIQRILPDDLFRVLIVLVVADYVYHDPILPSY